MNFPSAVIAAGTIVVVGAMAACFCRPGSWTGTTPPTPAGTGFADPPPLELHAAVPSATAATAAASQACERVISPPARESWRTRRGKARIEHGGAGRQQGPCKIGRAAGGGG